MNLKEAFFKACDDCEDDRRWFNGDWLLTPFFCAKISERPPHFVERLAENFGKMVPTGKAGLMPVTRDEGSFIANVRGLVLAPDAFDCDGCECGKCEGRDGERINGIKTIGQDVYRYADGNALCLNPSFSPILYGITVMAEPWRAKEKSPLYGFDGEELVAIVMPMNMETRAVSRAQ